MTTRLYRCLIVSMATSAFTGCSLSNCDKQLAELNNGDGSRTATLEVSDGCGGATVGYRTDLTLKRKPGGIFGEYGTVWTSRGWHDAQLRWSAPNHLEVVFRQLVKEDRIVLRTTRWYDVDIEYRFTETEIHGK